MHLSAGMEFMHSDARHWLSIQQTVQYLTEVKKIIQMMGCPKMIDDYGKFQSIDPNQCMP